MPTTTLSTLNPDLATFFGEHLEAGTEDMGAGTIMPTLKVTGGLSDNTLTNGEAATVGKLFHTALKQEFKEVEAYILYVKKCRLPDFNKTKMQLNYVIGGFLAEAKTPFVLYVKGLALKPFWDYQKDMQELFASYKVPMFAQKVIIGTEKREANIGGKVKKIDVVSIALKKGKNGEPEVETNMELLKVFLQGIEKMKASIALMIDNADGKIEEDPYIDQDNNRNTASVSTLPPVKQDSLETEDVSDEIPF